MESSDDESVIVPEYVSNYYFVDENSEPISLSALPVTWTTSEITQSSKKEIALQGYIDSGLQNFYKPVKAWKFDISGKEPEITVLCMDNSWIKLQKPRKSYQSMIRSVLITVNFLHLVKKDPELKKKAVWSELSDIFSFYDDKSSQKDLLQNKTLIEEAVKQDESLRRSEYLVAILEKNPRKQDFGDEGASTRVNKDFIVDDDEEEENVSDEDDGSSQEEDDDEEPFDSVCCICDNGGTLLCCEGVCMRSFHATPEAAEEADSGCVSLGLTEKDVKDIPNFKCKNCQYMQHQCFACGRLGSSDKSLGAEVFQCASATCGYFYHPRCVANVLHRDSEAAAKDLRDKISKGESYACPLHVCNVCKQPEDKTVPELQMAVCRRCPKAYHAKCLPREIAFEEKSEEGINEERAWKDLLVDRILIYCLKHEILDELGTPARNHIKFPGDEKKEKHFSASVSEKDTFPSKRKNLLGGATSQAGTAIQSKRKISQVGDLEKKSDRKIPKLKGTDTLKKTPIEKRPALTKKAGSLRTQEPKISLGDQLHALYTQTDPVKPMKSDKVDEDELIKPCAVKTVVPQLDSDSENRIHFIMKEASSLITMDDVLLKHKRTISGQGREQKMDTKAITQGKVQKYCESIKSAIGKLDGGGSIEDAKNICEPRVLNQVIKWKSKLRVYLAPFLYGMRYTSYGRHFTKLDKLQEIVDRIHWYVNSGDTIVDFCCGSNDFSWLMKQKLEQTGKNCHYKNYDLFQPKNDFGFEKRDWFSVGTNELPTGQKLVMGLNPPFGVKASRANQFIDKALKFQPKLLVLIVPPETERLEKKQYDLVWEDSEKLSGKSFYLPGSVDVNDKQIEDWNLVAPVLYLWSRFDWTSKHRAIAEKYGHLHAKSEHKQVSVSQFGSEAQSDAVMEVDDVSRKDDSPNELIRKAAGGTSKVLEDRSAQRNHEDSTRVKNEDNRGSKKKRNRDRKRQKNREEKQSGAIETHSEQKQKFSSPSDLHRGKRPHQLPNHTMTRKHSVECYSSRHRSSPSNRDIEQRHSPPSNRHHGHIPRNSPDPTMTERHSPEHYSSRRERTPSDMDIEQEHSPSRNHYRGGSHQLRDPTMDERHSLERYSTRHQRTLSDMEIELQHSRPSNRHHGVSHQLLDSTMDGIRSLGVPHQLSGPTMDVRHSLEHYSRQHRTSSDIEVERPAYESTILSPGHRDAPAYGGHDRYQIGSYPDKVDEYNPDEPDPYFVSRERLPINAGPRPANWSSASGYMRDTQGFSFNQPSLGETEPRHRPSSYSMGSSYGRTDDMPVSERYTLRLDEKKNSRLGQFGVPASHDMGAGMYDYQGVSQRYVNDHLSFASGPVNYRPPHRGGPPTGGWLGND